MCLTPVFWSAVKPFASMLMLCDISTTQSLIDISVALIAEDESIKELLATKGITSQTVVDASPMEDPKTKPIWRDRRVVYTGIIFLMITVSVILGVTLPTQSRSTSPSSNPGTNSTSADDQETEDVFDFLTGNTKESFVRDALRVQP